MHTSINQCTSECRRIGCPVDYYDPPYKIEEMKADEETNQPIRADKEAGDWRISEEDNI